MTWNFVNISNHSISDNITTNYVIHKLLDYKTAIFMAIRIRRDILEENVACGERGLQNEAGTTLMLGRG